MKTYRSEDLAFGDVTTWLYDEATGLMTNLGIVDLPEIPQEEIPWNNIVATGGGQWNEMESPTYSVPTQTDHNSTSGMLLEKIEVDGITMTIRNYIDELKRRKCGE